MLKADLGCAIFCMVKLENKNVLRELRYIYQRLIKSAS